MKILERIVDGLIKHVMSIDYSQFGFVPGRGTTDAIFVVCQLQEKYLAVNKRFYTVIVDLEKAFDHVSQKVFWWAISEKARCLGMDCAISPENVTSHVKAAWKKFRELLPVLTSRHLCYKNSGHVYSSCEQSVMLHASETWPLTKTNLQHNDRATIRHICSIKPDDVATVRSSELLAKLEDLDLILRERRLHWFGHVERLSGAVRTACDVQIDGRQGAGRSRLAWKKLTKKDCRKWKLTTVDPQERSTWRSGVRSAMLAPSQLPRKGPTDVGDAHAPAC